MLDYARKLTLDPGGVEKADIDALRTAGFKDADILDIALLTAYCNSYDRVAAGLGVEIEKSLKGE
jgi:alkylhydroperoxidase family enzyme